MNGPDIQPHDYSKLLNIHHLAKWTLERQREHADDLVVYEGAQAAFQAALRSQHVDGDGRWSAARRARKVEKHLKALVKASKQAAEAAAALRTSYARHVAHVQALPGQRQAKELRRAGARQVVGEMAAKSLHKTATGMAPQPGTPSAAPSDQVPPGPAAGGIRGINDLFSKGA